MPKVHKMRKGRKRKIREAKETLALYEERQDLEYKNAPHSFVFHRGRVGIYVRALIADIRQVLEPYTASKLRVMKKNVLKDFVVIAGTLNVSHFLIFSKTEENINLRIARIPRGPTLTFRVLEYCLSKDVLSSLKKPDLSSKLFDHHPLLVMNGFSAEDKTSQLMMTMFQNLFPSISINKVNLNQIKRCVLISYDPETKHIQVRHYMINLAPVGLSRGVKKLMKRHLPDLGKYHDITDYVAKGGNLSESEAEQDGPESKVVLSQKMSGRGNVKNAQSAIRLKEIGPRLTLELVKIQEGMCGGNVLHHAYIHRTPEDLAALKKIKEEKMRLKQARKSQQMENVKKKEKLKEEHRQRSLAGMKRAQQDADGVSSDSEDDDDKDNDKDEDDDAAHYLKEVGVNPDAELFPSLRKKRKLDEDDSAVPTKKSKNFSKNSKGSGKKEKKAAPPGFRKKDQVARQKKKKELEKQLGKKKKSEPEYGRKKTGSIKNKSEGGVNKNKIGLSKKKFQPRLSHKKKMKG